MNKYVLSVLIDLFASFVSAQVVGEDIITFTKDQMATIILPTTPDVNKGKYYRLDRCENMQIIFEEEKNPQARIPYIIVPNEDFIIDVSLLDLDGFRRDSTNINGVSFIGTYSKDVFGDKEGFYYYILDSTPDCRNDEDRYVYVGALRAFLQIDWRIHHQKGSDDKMEVVLHDNPNLILPLSTHRLDKKDILYDLQGRKLQHVPQKGLYIQNGKKVVVK